MKSIIFPFGSLLFFLVISSLSAQSWEPIPFINQAALDNGIIKGGEDGQWSQITVVEPNEASYLLYGTDVGGMFRSDDGKNWEPANTGYAPRGVGGFAIDPNNVDRVLAVGGSQGGDSRYGIFLSTNRGKRWSRKFKTFYKDYKQYRDEIAYDPTSSNDTMSLIAYWSTHTSANQTNAGKGSGLYKSEDGGESWGRIGEGADFHNKSVKVSPANGNVYLVGDGRTGGDKKFWMSQNEGGDFTQVGADNAVGMDVVLSRPDNVYLAREDGIYVSTNNGVSFTKVDGSSIPPDFNVFYLDVSPADPDRMGVSGLVAGGGNFAYRRFFTHDAGITWMESNIPETNYFFNRGPRPGYFAWHPTDTEKVWSCGGGCSTVSTDGGATFLWNNRGINNFSPNGITNLNPFNPDLLMVAGWDKGGAFSSDGGKVWIKSPPYPESNIVGGHGFSGYALTADSLVALGKPLRSGPRFLCHSQDGGQTWNQTETTTNGYDVVCPNPRNRRQVFLGNYRSNDGGLTWEQLPDMNAVFTYNPVENEFGDRQLYGVSDSVVRVSTDNGDSWTDVVSIGETSIGNFRVRIGDIAYDHETNKLYVIKVGRLYAYQISANGAVAADSLADITSLIPPDQFGQRAVKTVCVDPRNPANVYLGSSSDNRYLTDNTIMRSTDAGETWEVISTSATYTTDDAYGNGGGHFPQSIRVDPITGDLLVYAGTFGLWRFNQDGTTSAGSEPVSVRETLLTAVYPNPAATNLTVKINGTEQRSMSLSITDMTGRQVLHRRQTVVEGTQLVEIDVSSLPAGTYALRLADHRGQDSLLFVKE